MRFLNSIGNRVSGWALFAILGQRLKDTLCGTTVLLRRDYKRIVAQRVFFGDFDLLFGAAKQNLKIVGLPVRYRARTYGETKIRRFANGRRWRFSASADPHRPSAPVGASRSGVRSLP